MNRPLLLLLLLTVLLVGGCAGANRVFEYDILGDADTELEPLCLEEYAVCGDILIPTPLDDEARMIGIGLYRNLPAVGPPFASLYQEEFPLVEEGGRFKVRVSPVLEEGELYIWASFYVGQQFRRIPLPGVDFTGHLDEPLTLGTGPVVFDDIYLELAGS